MTSVFHQVAKHAAQVHAKGAAPALWPAMAQVLHPPRLQKLSERIKYRTRMLLCRHYIPAVLDTLACYPAWASMFAKRPYFYSSPMSLFLDRRFNTRQRFEAFCINLQVAHQQFAPHIVQAFAQDVPVTLFNVEGGLNVQLTVNPINPKEGYWALILNDAEGNRVFNMTFAFLGVDTVLITSIQGGSNQMTNTKDIIHRLTKQTFGLRPHQLLLNVLQTLCSCIGITQLLGIDPINHIKGRWNKRRKQLKFDYRTFWSDMGSTERVNAHWAIPIALQLKDLQAIDSKKRSQYRQRYALLDTMQACVKEAMTAMTVIN